MKEIRNGQTPPLSSEEVASLVRDLPQGDIAAIVSLEPTRYDLEAALAWANLESDVMGKERRPLTGKIADIYEILTRDEDFAEDHPDG